MEAQNLMTYGLPYFDEVDTDIHTAKTWYKDQKKGLEIEFSTEIKPLGSF